jgi:hypothetical protein
MILSIIEFAFRGLLMVVLFFVLKILSKVIGDFFNLSFYTLAVDCILLCSVIALFLKPFLSLSKGIVSYLKEFTSQFLIAGAIIASTYFLSSYFEPNFSYRFVPINGRDMFKLFLFFFLFLFPKSFFFGRLLFIFLE